MSKVCGMKWSMPVAAAALLAFTACSNDGKVAGGTEAESTIALQVQLADGSPAGHSRVRMLPNDFLSDGASGAAWTESDEAGFVAGSPQRARFQGLGCGTEPHARYERGKVGNRQAG